MTNPEIDRQLLPTLPPQDQTAKLPWESIDPEEPTAALAAGQLHSAAVPARAVPAGAAQHDQPSAFKAGRSDEHLSAQAFLGDDEDVASADTPTMGRWQPSAQSAPRAKWTGALSADEGSAPDPTAAEQAPVPSGVLSDPGSEQPRHQWADIGESVTMESVVVAPVQASIDLAGPDNGSVSHLWAEPAAPEEVEVAAKAPAATIVAPVAMAPIVPAMPAETASSAPAEAVVSSESAIDRDADESDDGEDEPDEFADADDTADAPAQLQSSGGGWTIPLLCLGIGLIACCVVIPQADANGRLYYERQMLQADFESIEKQVAVNGEFINRAMDDPTLAERLAGRQMKTIRKGQKVLVLKHEPPDTDMSPFALVTVAPPALPPPYKPVGGGFASLCYDARSRLYVMGVAMTMIAAGLVLGVGPRKSL